MNHSHCAGVIETKGGKTMPTCVDCKKKHGTKIRLNGVQLCDPCFVTREEKEVLGGDTSGEDDQDELLDNGPKLVGNELLCYAFSYINCCTPEMLMNAIRKAFSDEDIHYAKDLLWREYGHLLDKGVRRRDGLTRTATEAILEDIVLQGVMVIKNANCVEKVVFCAMDAKKLPKFSPEEVNMQALFNKVMAMETQLNAVQEQVAKNAAKIEEKEVSKVQPQAYAAMAVPLATPLASERIWPSLASAIQPPLPSVIQPQHHKSRHESGNRAQVNRPQSPAVPGSSDQPGGKWMIPRHERRQRIREAAKDARVVTGSGSNTGLHCGVRTKIIFVYHVNNSYTMDNIKTTMKNAGAEPVHVRQTSHSDAANKSFRVVICEDDMDKVMVPEFWEDGIMCREWIN